MGKSAVTNKNELVKAEIAPISELHEMARGYARDGIKIFPCIPDGKAPAIAGGFTKATCNLAQIDKWWGENENFNIALCPEDNGWCVIDVEAAGLRDWQLLCLKHPPFETFTNSTPGGGLHVYFTGSLPSKTKIQGLQIDTRGRGGYVLVPPSRVLVDKGPYKGQIRYYDTELQVDVAPLPDWIAELFVVKPRAPSPATGAPVERELLEARLEQLDPDCDRGTWRDIVAGIHATNVPDDENGEYRRELAHRWSRGDLWVAPACKYDDVHVDLVFYGMPPKEGGVGFGTIDYYARQAGFDGPSAAPRASVGETFAGVEMPPVERSKYAPVDLLRVATGAEPEYHDDDEGQGRGIMPDYPEGCVVYHYGKPGSHKTNCQLCETLEAFLRGKRVVFVAAEGTYLFVRMRLAMMCRHMGITLEQLMYGGEGPHGPLGRFAVIEDAPLLLDSGEVDAFIAALPFEPHIIVIDTLSEALPGADQNSTPVTSGVGQAAKRLQKRFKALVCIIHHPGKDEDRGMLGGSGLLGHAGGVVRYTADKDAGIITAHVEKMRDGCDNFSKGLRVRKLDYVKPHKRTGEPVTIALPIVERIPVDQWAAMLAAKEAGPGVRALVDPTEPADLDKFNRHVFWALRKIDAHYRGAGLAAREVGLDAGSHHAPGAR